MRVVLLEPDPQGRVSGGYLYNAKLCAAVTSLEDPDFEFERRALDANEPSCALKALLSSLRVTSDTLLLLDSLLLHLALTRSLLELRESTGCKLGCLMHALPSFVERAHRADLGTAAWLPTERELGALGELDVVVAPGPYIPRLLASAGNATPCAQCLPGFAQRARTSRAKCTSPARILSVATLVPNKGYLDAIEVLAQLTDLDWRWRIVGSMQTHPAHVAELRAALREHGLESRVDFAGERPSDAVWSELGAADVLLHPSYTENQPLIVMESLAAAVPVLGYRVGGMQELVLETGGGALAQLRDVAGLAAALRRLLTNPEAYWCASRDALTAARWPSWEQSARGLRRGLQHALRR